MLTNIFTAAGCESFKGLKNVHLVDLPISFLVIFPKKTSRYLCKDLATRILIVELFYNIKKAKNLNI